MANKLHGYCSTMFCECMDIDALNRCGIYTDSDLDNGVMVTLGDMTQDSANKVEGFEYKVAPATLGSEYNLYVVNTPEVGYNLDMQEHTDPRVFYNEAGRPMSIKKLVPSVDEIEVTAECFADSTLPTSTNKYVKVTTGGKLQASASEPSTDGAYFELVGLHFVEIGWERVPTAILRYNEFIAKA